MIITLVFAAIIFASLWPYLAIMGALNFKKNENSMEDHLPGRPARRTVGRKNQDIMKAIFGVLVFYIMICGSLYGMPELRKFMSDIVMIGLVSLSSGFAVYYVTPYNRMAHAYISTGQLSVIHLCCSLSTFVAMSSLLHMNYFEFINMILLSILIFGAMLVVSNKKAEVGS